MRERVAAGSRVVPFKALFDVARDTHVMARRITVAAKNIDEASSDPAHASGRRTCQTATEGEEFCGKDVVVLRRKQFLRQWRGFESCGK